MMEACDTNDIQLFPNDAVMVTFGRSTQQRRVLAVGNDGVGVVKRIVTGKP